MSLSDSPRFHRIQTSVFSAVDAWTTNAFHHPFLRVIISALHRPIELTTAFFTSLIHNVWLYLLRVRPLDTRQIRRSGGASAGDDAPGSDCTAGT